MAQNDTPTERLENLTTEQLYNRQTALLRDATDRWTGNRERVDIGGKLWDIDAECQHRGIRPR